MYVLSHLKRGRGKPSSILIERHMIVEKGVGMEERWGKGQGDQEVMDYSNLAANIGLNSFCRKKHCWKLTGP